MKKLKLLALTLVSTAILTVSLVSTHKTKAFADTLSEIPGYTQQHNLPNPKATELPTSLYRSNSISNDFYIYNIPGVQRIQYGTSGEGRPLYYYKIGNGENTLFANFAIHGFEDSWAQDGYQLTKIAHQLIEKFSAQNKQYGLDNWSVIIVPCANPDGVLDGWTNNGPGRAQISKSIDLNRDFPTYFQPEYNSRNYTGPTPLEAPEAKALADLVPKISRQSRNMVLLDVHGWLDMTIGDPQIGQYFINNLGLSRNVGYIPAGHGYFVSYGHAEGAEVSLVELPDTTSPSQVNSRDYVGKLYNSMNELMRDGTGFTYMNKTGVVVNTSTLNVRSGATTDGYKLGTLYGGQQVHILGKINGWYKIYDPSIGYAYVYGDYINITGDGGSITAPSTGWQTIDGHKYYILNNGQKATDWREINGKWYYFNPQGQMQTGLINYNGEKFYLGNDGVKVTGWYNLNGTPHYFYGWGMATGWQTIDGHKYYFGNDGVRRDDWEIIDGNWYYFNPQGQMQTGLINYNGEKFYLGNNGVKVTGWCYVDGGMRYFYGWGMATGWQTMDGHKYYFGNDGIRRDDWEIIDGNWYYFNPQGQMQTGLINYNGEKFYLGNNGVKITGWYYLDGGMRYFYGWGMATGWQTIDGHKYYFGNDGIRRHDWEVIDGNWYYFNPEGQMQTGLINYNGEKFYLGDNGVKITGWYYLDGGMHYFYGWGMATGWQTIDGHKYYFGNDGIRRHDWEIIDGNWYYFNPEGQMQTGLIDYNGEKFYLGDNGIKITGWYNLNGKTHYFYGWGMATGWQTIDGRKYHFDQNGCLL